MSISQGWTYLKDRKLGEGTFAVVYSGWAVPPQSNQPASKDRIQIAIKKIKLKNIKDGVDIGALREIKYLQELKHPNIINLITVFSEKHHLNLILEHLDADLEMVIKNKQVVFGACDIKSWTLMLMRGLYHCHRNFIIHRDLKPNNLLLSKSGELKIADFGLARMYGDPESTMTSQVVTRWYRPPELLLGAKLYGDRVDIWAAGCIFAELMLRTPYFAAETDIGQLDMIFRALGTPTESEWPGLKSLPDYFEFKVYQRMPLKTLFTAASQDSLDLLEKMVTYDPLKRPTCEECLSHEYFTKLPRPTPPHKLPRDIQNDTTFNANKRKLFEDAAKPTNEDDRNPVRRKLNFAKV